jgi:hypothetical protein
MARRRLMTTEYNVGDIIYFPVEIISISINKENKVEYLLKSVIPETRRNELWTGCYNEKQLKEKCKNE